MPELAKRDKSGPSDSTLLFGQIGGQKIAKSISKIPNHDTEEAGVMITEWHDDFEPKYTI